MKEAWLGFVADMFPDFDPHSKLNKVAAVILAVVIIYIIRVV